MVLLALIISTAIKGGPAIRRRAPHQLLLADRPGDHGFRAGIFGTIWLMSFTAVFAVPLGIAAALYLEEFADNSRW